MGFSNGVLTFPFKKIALNGRGDMQRALGTSSMSEFNMLTSAPSSGKINPMAKYKPFKNSNVTFANATAWNNARAATRYGLKPPSVNGNETFSPNAYEAPPFWTYDRPRGIFPAQSINEPLRAMDLVKDTTSTTVGYDAFAVSPIYLQMQGDLTLASESAIFCLWGESYVNNYHPYTEGYQWHSDRSLSLSDIFNSSGGSSAYLDRYIGMVVYRYNAAGTAIEAANVLVTHMTLRQFNNLSTKLLVIPLTGEDGSVWDDKSCPKLDVIGSNNYEGRKYLCVVCVSSTGPSSNSNYYEILPNNYTFFSLGFDSENPTDRVETVGVAPSGVNQVTPTLNTGITISKTSTTGDWEKWNVVGTLTGTFETSDSYQQGSFEVVLTCTLPSGTFDGDPTSQSYVGQRIITKSVTFQSASQTYTRDLAVPTDFGDLYIYKDGVKQMQITAVLRQGTKERAFTNTLIVTSAT